MKLTHPAAAPALALALAFGLLAAPARAAESTLVVGIAADPTGLDPEAVRNNTSGFVMGTIFDNLAKYKLESTQVEPGIADRWEVSADGMTYAFHIRPGVKFHDGTPLDAKAVFWNVDRQFNKDNPDYIYNTGPVENHAGSSYAGLASYRVVDDETVEFKFKAPLGGFLNSLAMVGNGLASPAAAHKFGKDFRNHPVGSGPFVFREWRPRDQIILDANPAYWAGKPKVDHLIFKEIPEGQAALLALKRGEIQILGDLGGPSIPAVRADSNLVLVTQPGLAVSGIGLPTDVPPFNDRRVRQALNYAVDKNAINKALFQGLAEPMTSPLPEAQWGFDKSLKGYAYDPTRAKALLAEAGVKNLKVEFLTYNSPRGYNPAGADLAVALQDYLQKVGIETEVRKLEIGAFLSTVRSGNYKGIFLVGWTGDNGDPDNFMGELWGARNIPVINTPHYRNPEYEKILAAALVATDQAKRAELYAQGQKIVLEDAPWVFVNSVMQARAIRKEVKGFHLSPTQMFLEMHLVSLQP